MNKPYLKLTVFLFLFLFNRTFGQPNIPDTNFAAAIRAACSTCIDGSNNLTSLASTITTLNVNHANISSLAGIEGFTQLNIFSCEYNNLISVPTLPSTLTQLFCEGNQISSLPALPSGLVILALKSNNLTSLPSLPSGLVRLNINQNHITLLPTLPNTLESLSAYLNNLTSLPSPLPTSLKVLGVNSNNISSVPNLPSSLTFLDVAGNSLLTTLPTLPDGLTGLYTGSGITYISNRPIAITCAVSSLPICSTGIGCTVLPLELIDFQIITHDKNIEITWTTSSESNISDFTLERSDNSEKFYPLSIQQSKGDLESVSHYSFIDENPNGINYYRLKTNEKDGSFTYSKILSAVLNKQKQALAYPNPFKNSLKIKTSESYISDNVHIQLMDLTGRIYFSKTYNAEETINTQDIPKGMYIVSILQGNETINLKMIKE